MLIAQSESNTRIILVCHFYRHGSRVPTTTLIILQWHWLSPLVIGPRLLLVMGAEWQASLYSQKLPESKLFVLIFNKVLITDISLAGIYRFSKFKLDSNPRPSPVHIYYYRYCLGCVIFYLLSAIGKRVG